MSGVWALVPIKPPAAGKSRLAPALCADERAALARHMACDVLTALRAAPALEGVAMLAPAGSADDLAAEFGCLALDDDAALDLNGNLDRAVRLLAAGGAGTVLIVPCDLPALTSSDVTALLAAHASGVTVAPAERDGGTNALAMTPPGAIGCRFGPDSARRHLDAASQGRLAVVTVALAGFARDVDTVDDVLWLCDLPGTGSARRYVEESGICTRLRRDGK